jgi:hypothetical protein
MPSEPVHHDRIAMVAGGIGITFFPSFLPDLLATLRVNALSFPSSTVITPAV